VALLGRLRGASELPEAVMKKLSISVVEDDPFVRGSIGRLLRSLGYTVEVFPSGADLLASPHLDETACLISDVHMPGMSGVELYQCLIDAGRVIPTILMTAYPNDVERTRALNDGILCYIRKPVDDQHLIRCLRAALGFGDSP
jgi:FixJ family two-component response regulator